MKGDMVRECYSCLKMMIQARLHVGFIAIYFLLKVHHQQGKQLALSLCD